MDANQLVAPSLLLEPSHALDASLLLAANGGGLYVPGATTWDDLSGTDWADLASTTWDEL